MASEASPWQYLLGKRQQRTCRDRHGHSQIGNKIMGTNVLYQIEYKLAIMRNYVEVFDLNISEWAVNTFQDHIRESGNRRQRGSYILLNQVWLPADTAWT